MPKYQNGKRELPQGADLSKQRQPFREKKLVRINSYVRDGVGAQPSFLVNPTGDIPRETRTLETRVCLSITRRNSPRETHGGDRCFQSKVLT